MTRKSAIEDVALDLFASEGFEAASLGKIAEAVGIRKPSIYAHFRSKEDLFLHVFKQALRSKKRMMLRHLLENRDRPFEETFLSLAKRLMDDNESDAQTRFLLRMSYFPPSSLHDQVMELMNPFFMQAERLLTSLLERPLHQTRLQTGNAQEAALAYITVLEGVLAEAIYTTRDKATRRLEAVFPIYCRGVLINK
ncbi:TetR/AcrR family transcriptional regulator [Saccharibacillus sp. JS10]|uniref:TetR/AcrR family transcriptional regulator n=1 Tax=Saccharibacillus sp. JS10 TaxID=2950552 RepID=UPI00210917B9|nr:TetR/AcrR family transcriptional regulator [Saccharibacillus sp. JS10]MCQ4088099.1 TetR/AcrR family transcriptional regulator [Saccharibacillus sp. JS10]